MSKAKPPADDDGWLDPPPPLNEPAAQTANKGFLSSLYAPIGEQPSPTGNAAKKTSETSEPEEEEEIDPFAPASGSWFTKHASKQLNKNLWKSIFRGGLVKIDPVSIDNVPNEDSEEARLKRIYTIVWCETLAIIGLSLLFVFILPFGNPVYRYYAKMENQSLEDAQRNRMLPLYMPNLTNRAVLSWAATSISEIMTFGFGDYEIKLKQQKNRFTTPGWSGFVKTFVEKEIGEKFQQRQLVVTTAPADTPVIVSQGENKEHVYEWHVQAPVIITFATNNNITSSTRAIVDLTIIRVPHEHNASGIAINIWRQRQG